MVLLTVYSRSYTSREMQHWSVRPTNLLLITSCRLPTTLASMMQAGAAPSAAISTRRKAPTAVSIFRMTLQKHSTTRWRSELLS